MKHIAFAVMLLAVMQATPPVPRKASDQSAGGSGNVNKQAKAKHNPPSDPVSAQPSNSSAENQKNSGKPSPTNQEGTVSVGKLPPVSVSKDAWDYLSILFTGALVVAAGGTLALLYWQAKKTAEATKAMVSSVEVQREAQRAHLAIGFDHNPWVALREGGGCPSSPIL